MIPRIRQKPCAPRFALRFQKRLAVFDVGIATPRLNQKHCADLVTLSKRGLYPLWLRITVISARVEVLLFEIAHCLWIRSFFYSNFKKQNRKGSPQSLIYPYMGKFTSFVIKQFFAFGKVNQTLMRSRLRRFLPLSVALNQPKKNSLLFFVGEIKPRIKQKPNADLTFWDEAQKLFFKKLSKNRRNFSFSVV